MNTDCQLHKKSDRLPPGLGQELADHLEVVVFAPNDLLWYSEGGGAPVIAPKDPNPADPLKSAEAQGCQAPGLYGKGEAVAVNRYDTERYMGGTAYLGKDVMGSVAGVTDGYGVTGGRYEYDVFGEPHLGDFGNGVGLGYTGKPYDGATGLYDYGYRDYMPAAARFTTEDPVRDGANWFAYVNNDPVNWVDLWGLEPIVYTKGPGVTDDHMEITKRIEENIKNSGTLVGELLKDIIDSDRTITVYVNIEKINDATPGDDNNLTWDEAKRSADGTGGDVYVRFDPTDNDVLSDGTISIPEATYVHEVVGHGYPMAYGTNPIKTKDREVEATAVENLYRASQDWDQRSKYGDWDVPQFPAGKSAAKGGAKEK